ncbi:MAG: carbohydrate kinase family protein [Calditrichia bacterium]|nr:carbohydrate kinase family protein [Calditrichia bacterium]
MKIAVVGTISKDIIIPFESIPTRSLGGIFYSITTLMNFLRNGDTVLPVSYYSEDISYLMQAFEEKWDNVDFSCIFPVKERNFQQILEYSSLELRAEKAFFFFPYLLNENFNKALEADFIIVNMVTGHEMPVEVFQKFTQDVYDKTYLNVKSLLYKVDELGNKIQHRPDDIFEWLNYARFIQLNEQEYNIINQEGMDFNRYWAGLLRPSQNVFLTLGEKGVWWITNKDGLMIKKYPSYKVDQLKDKTGCGEVFGSAFAYGFLKKKKISKAIEFGILAASASTQIVGTENFYQLIDEMNILNTKVFEAVY